MSLAAANTSWVLDRKRAIQELVANEQNFNRWVEHSCSYLVHHDAECCETARMWFLAYARSMEVGALSQYQLRAPTWLTQMFTWGPTKWPISWCEVVNEKIIDCGVFAVLAREVFKAQGFEAHPAQALLSYSDQCTRHWKDLWKSGDKKSGDKKSGDKKPETEKNDREAFPWIGDEVVYHELCLVEMPGGSAKIYDSTLGNWYEPQGRIGFAAVLAVRSECPRLLHWGDKILTFGEWTEL